MDVLSYSQNDGTYTLNFKYEGSPQIESQQETGHWKCDGNNLHVNIENINGEYDPRSYVYKLEELTDTFHILSIEVEDCESIIGDCENLVFELVRID